MVFLLNLSVLFVISGLLLSSFTSLVSSFTSFLMSGSGTLSISSGGSNVGASSFTTSSGSVISYKCIYVLFLDKIEKHFSFKLFDSFILQTYKEQAKTNRLLVKIYNFSTSVRYSKSQPLQASVTNINVII